MRIALNTSSGIDALAMSSAAQHNNSAFRALSRMGFRCSAVTPESPAAAPRRASTSCDPQRTDARHDDRCSPGAAVHGGSRAHLRNFQSSSSCRDFTHRDQHLCSFRLAFNGVIHRPPAASDPGVDSSFTALPHLDQQLDPSSLKEERESVE